MCRHTSVNFFERRITTAFLLPLKAPYGNGKLPNPEVKGFIESRGQERGAGNDPYDAYLVIISDECSWFCDMAVNKDRSMVLF